MKYLALHETGVARSVSLQRRAVNEYHKNQFGMLSKMGWWIGYHTFIDTDGSLTRCREYGEESAAIKGHNCDAPERCDTISVCVAFNGDKELLSDVQVKRLREYAFEVKAIYPDIKFTYHRNLQANRTCPGLMISDEYLSSVLFPQEIMKVKAEDDIVKQSKIDEIARQVSFIQAWVDRLTALVKQFFNK